MTPPADDYALIPPHSREAEMCVLGAMVLSPATAIDEAQAALRVSDFYRPAHGVIFAALAALAEEVADPSSIDLVVLREKLAAAGDLERVGGVPYLVELVDGVPTTANLGQYAAIVREHSLKRAVLTHALAMRAAALNPASSSADLLEMAEKGLYDVVQGRTGLPLVTAGDAARRLLEAVADAGRAETPPSIQTGLYALDEASGGLHAGELVVVAGDTGSGKTTLADSIAVNVADQGGRVLVVSVEMSDLERAQRFVQSVGRVHGYRLRKPRLLEADDWQRLHEAAGALADLPIRIHWGKATTAQVVSQARRAAAQMGGLDLVVVDYLQLLTPADGQGRSRAERVSAMAWAMKMDVAMGLRVPVLLLSQLSRAGLKEERPPTKHDLKESGDIENHADAIWLLHQMEDGSMGLCQDKHRSMPRTTWTGDTAIRLDWDRMTTTFTAARFGDALPY